MRRFVYALLLCALPASASAAVTVDSVTESGTTTAASRTIAHTTATSAVMLVACHIYNTTISAMTYNGTALTQAVSTGNNENINTEIWTLNNPTSGNHNVVVTFGSSQESDCEVMTFTGADTTTPFGTGVASHYTASGTSTTQNTTASTDALVVSAFTAWVGLGTITPSVGQTDVASDAITNISYMTTTKAGSATTATGYSWVNDFYRWGQASIAVLPLGGGGGGGGDEEDGGGGGTGSTYYVSKSGSDANDCSALGAQSTTQSLQKLTIAGGISCLLSPGDTLFIHTGTYVHEVIREVDFPVTGTYGNVIAVAAFPSETVTLTQGGGANVIRFQDGSRAYIEIQDLILDGAGVNGDSMVFFSDGVCCGDHTPSHDLYFTRLEIKNGYMNGILGGGANHVLRDLLVHGNARVPTAVYPQGGNGAYLTPDNMQVIGGRYYDNRCFGIRIWDSAHPTQEATDNVVDGVRIYDNGYGYGLGGTSDCGSTGGGISLGDTRNTIKNSFIYRNQSGGDDYFSHAVSNNYYNNVFYANGGAGIFSSCSGCNMRNNVIYNNAGGTITGTRSGGTEDFNLTSNPGFTDAANGDFTYTNQLTSGTVDTGTSLPTVTSDFSGSSRPLGSGYDIGPYEYVPPGGGSGTCHRLLMGVAGGCS